MNLPATEKLLRRKESAALLKEHFGVGSASTLAKLAVYGGGPPYRLMGRTPVYSEADLLAWAKSRLSAPVQSTAEREARGATSLIPVPVAP